MLCYIIRMEQIKSKWQSFWELVRFALIALIIVIPIRVFIAEPFIVSGSSMVPTFENGDYLIIDKVSYELGSPKRDDVVVFRYPGDTSKFFIKRIIGLPNETVDIKGNEVTITNGDYKEGFKLEQPFVKNISNNDTHFELKNDEYFVMGDNRSASSDSRYWGAVKKDLLTGKALLRLLPVNKVDFWPGSYIQENK
ncbi:signal peptidase I [Candidatus Nomurabacteria bacterium RIFOXYB1_FULL_39_16]|uniref:Signal peptidase I n=2 Tax=Candidatus Nomuraibacteriota TaxID=1752729 RepID=A0A1F6YTD9_9BACT|nr:MAG: signal peptidase I [Candidatus Nomurabacteria bacterium RIFOXYB1_FULL_39_16]OGJ15570.1 MAG: signal peptidase I [Candidatus Nomurabacteria bacterium RIFOXYD1_FULL_39_12]